MTSDKLYYTTNQTHSWNLATSPNKSLPYHHSLQKQQFIKLEFMESCTFIKVTYNTYKLSLNNYKLHIQHIQSTKIGLFIFPWWSNLGHIRLYWNRLKVLRNKDITTKVKYRNKLTLALIFIICLRSNLLKCIYI